MAKAFDTVDHEILFTKLYALAIRGLPLKIVKNYLHNRKKLATINEVKSNMQLIDIGVPQGTILGPLLFIVYINDIF